MNGKALLNLAECCVPNAEAAGSNPAASIEYL